MTSQLGVPMELIVDARRDPARLPVALISSGVVLSSAVLGLIIFKAPGGIFLRLHGNMLGYLYYGVLIALVIFGRLLGGAVPRDVVGWHAAGKTLLWVSVMTLVLVFALGGLTFLKLK